MSHSVAPWVYDVNEQNFDREVIERSRERPVVVDFWATWCGPCRMLGPVLEKLVEERKGEILLARLDIDQSQRLAMEFGIEAVPAVKAFRDGRPVLEFVGVLPETQLRAFLDRLLPTAAERAARQAQDLEGANPAEAERLYRQALAEDGNQPAALVGLARLLLAQGKEREAEELLNRVPPGGDPGAEAERLNAVLLLRRLGQQCGDEAAARRRQEADPENPQFLFELGCALAAAGRYPEALDRLVTAAERDRKLAAEKVREVMVKIFHIIGVRSPLADEYRDRLARALY